MNRNQLLQQCQEELASQRAYSQNLAYQNLIKAKQHPEFLQIEKEEKTIIFELGKQNAFGKPTAALATKLREIRNVKEAFLNSINLTTKDLTPKYNCELCKDLGYVGTNMCKCLSLMLHSKMIEECGAGKKVLAGFKDFNADISPEPTHRDILLKLKKKFENLAYSYPQTPYKFIVLSGKTGVGKTFITECFANELIDKGYLVSFISSFGMNNLFLSYHTCFDNQKQSYMNSLIDPEVLVIDDLGTEPNLKNVTTPYLYLLISERSRLNKLTVITTNLAPIDVLSKYNERVFSRLFHKQESFIVQIEGADLRLMKQQ